MVDCPKGIKLVITESDLVSYPGMFLYNGDSDLSLEGRFAPYPKREEQGGHNMLQMMVKEREDFLASCDGAARTFPWRTICISTRDAQMADNDMVYRLARSYPDGEDYMLYALLNGGAAYIRRDPAYPGIDGAFSSPQIECTEEVRRWKTVSELQRRVAKMEMLSHKLLDQDGNRQQTIFSDGKIRIIVEINHTEKSWQVREEQM